jgi:hypothetical protein
MQYLLNTLPTTNLRMKVTMTREESFEFVASEERTI